ncbi:MAG: PTS sugar transporter subunit IIB [Oscillospiraceae bacterium]|nr:PTS sugar transporter subunit IIB [Oscillospiraceae bacterium]
MRIQAVCGFGCGSSLFLKIKLDEVLQANGLSAEIFCGDVGTCLSQNCDAIFISEELADRVQDRAKVPVVVINNFMNKQEVEEKTLAFFKNQAQEN